MPAAQQQVALPPRYRVARHIANGGMASVWAAEDSLLERLVAVKVLAPGFAADPTARRRFTREARAAARVSDHPHVVTIFDIGEHDGHAFIVMEHLAGGTLADRLKRPEPVPPPTALQWLREAASALDAAHAADIVHRDVKPGNLLLDTNGRLAVADFGIASLAGETAVTMAGQVMGTAAYLSPEQARGQPATPASDRYSLAVVAYELLCGRRPFDGDTPVAQARAHAEVDPPAPVGPCEAAADVLTHGLAKDPAQRPPSAMAFVDDVERALGAIAEPTRLTHVAAARPRTPAPEWHERPRFARDAPETRAVGPRRAPAPPPPAAPVSRRRGGSHRAAWAALLLALCVAGGAAAALIGDNGNAGNGASRSTAAAARHAAASQPPAKPKKTTPKPKATAPAPGAPTTPTTPTTAAAPADSRSAAVLNNTGFAMLPANPQGALPLLQRAVEKFRAQGDTSSVDYAYSLYNVGWALRLAGRPAEAIPYLEERLRISNYKRGVVEQELRTAQQAAGQAPAGGDGAKKPKGQGDGQGNGNGNNNG